MAINMYLISASTRKGVFGSGTIQVVMLEDDPSRAGKGSDSGGPKREPEKLYEWELTPRHRAGSGSISRPRRTI